MYTKHYGRKLKVPKSLRWAFPEKCPLFEEYWCALLHEFAKPLSGDCHVHDRVPFKSTGDVKNVLKKQMKLVFINKQKCSLWSITNPLAYYGSLQQHPAVNMGLVFLDKIHPSSSICCYTIICIFSSKSKTIIIIWHNCKQTCWNKLLEMFLSCVQNQTGSKTSNAWEGLVECPTELKKWHNPIHRVDFLSSS